MRKQHRGTQTGNTKHRKTKAGARREASHTHVGIPKLEASILPGKSQNTILHSMFGHFREARLPTTSCSYPGYGVVGRISWVQAKQPLLYENVVL